MSVRVYDFTHFSRSGIFIITSHKRLLLYSDIITFGSPSFKVDPVAFVSGSYFTQRDELPVIVLKTSIKMAWHVFDFKYCTSIVRWLQYKYIAHMFRNEKKTINISKNMVVFGIFHFSPMFTNNNL